jgi:hypothetical protein
MQQQMRRYRLQQPGANKETALPELVEGLSFFSPGASNKVTEPTASATSRTHLCATALVT